MGHFGLKSGWALHDQLRPQPKAGDKLEFDRGALYNHVGIADGKGGVYHFSGDPRGGKTKSQARWRHDRISDVAHGDLIRINNSLDYSRSPFDEDEIIQRCKQALGFFLNSYDLPSNNCEHKANEMRYGSPQSQQVETAALASGGVLVSFFVIAGLIVSFATGSGNRQEPARR